MNRTARTIVAAGLLPLSAVISGCCAVSEYFCGPDRSRWVQVSFSDPAATIRTLREALRRDDEEVLYRCLGESFKRHYRLGSVEWAIAWGRIRDEVPGIHLMGNGEVSAPEELRSGRVRFTLTRAGHSVAVELERVAFWEVAWDGPEGGDSDGAFVPRLARPLAVVTRSEPGEPYRVSIDLEFEAFGRGPEIDASKLRRAGVGHEWKVYSLEPVDEA